jgi:hypothetical protein
MGHSPLRNHPARKSINFEPKITKKINKKGFLLFFYLRFAIVDADCGCQVTVSSFRFPVAVSGCSFRLRMPFWLLIVDSFFRFLVAGKKVAGKGLLVGDSGIGFPVKDAILVADGGVRMMVSGY